MRSTLRFATGSAVSLMGLASLALASPPTVAGARSVAAASGPNLQATGSPSWLDTLNSYRLSIGLPAVVPDSSLQPGVDSHVRYLAATASIAHGEDRTHPLYSPVGALAASQSLLGGWTGRSRTDRDLIEDWVIAPFHALHLFEPRFQRTAFSAIRGEPGARLDVAATLNVVGGIGPRVSIDRAIVFPGRDSSVPLNTFRTESPDPLTHCPGFRAPAGLPLIVLFPTAPVAPTASLSTGTKSVDVCVIDRGYRNPDPGAQATGRSVLTQKNAVLIVPVAPLEVGATYTATVNGGPAGTVEWRFSIAPELSALPVPAGTPIALRSSGRSSAAAKTTVRAAKPATPRAATTTRPARRTRRKR